TAGGVGLTVVGPLPGLTVRGGAGGLAGELAGGVGTGGTVTGGAVIVMAGGATFGGAAGLWFMAGLGCLVATWATGRVVAAWCFRTLRKAPGLNGSRSRADAVLACDASSSVAVTPVKAARRNVFIEVSPVTTRS